MSLTVIFSHYLICELVEAIGSTPSTPQRINLNSAPKAASGGSMAGPNATAQKRGSLKSHTSSNVPVMNKSDIIPVIVPRTSIRSEPGVESRKEVGVAGRLMSLSLQSRAADIHKFPNRDEMDKPPISPLSESASSKDGELGALADKNDCPTTVASIQGMPTSEKSLNYTRCLGMGTWNKLTELNASTCFGLD